MKCCQQRDDLYVVRDGKFVKYIPPTEKFRTDALGIYLDIGKALDLIDSWEMEEIEWSVEQIGYYLKNVIKANMDMVENPKNKTYFEISTIDYQYPDSIDENKMSAPGILLPKELNGTKDDIVVDGSHRLIRCYREKKGMKLKTLTEKQYKEISIS